MTNENVICICGRLHVKPHCPTCGSYVVTSYASIRDKVTRPTGESVELGVFRCRRCGRKFNEDDWKLHCNAPLPSAGRPRKELVGHTPIAESELPEAMVKALNELKTKRGWK